MNPVNQLMEKLSPTQTKFGVVTSVNGDITQIATGGVVETWLGQSGLVVGDSVIIFGGRLIKSKSASPSDAFEV